MSNITKNFKFRGDLNFIKPSNPFYDFNLLDKLAKDFIKNNPYEMVYDGNDYFLRAALLFHNHVMNLIESEKSEDDLNLLLPLMKIIVDYNLPIALMPVLEYKGNTFYTVTAKMRCCIQEDERNIPKFEKTFKKNLDVMIINGRENNPPYALGVYNLMFTPIMYNPTNFERIRNVMIRYFTYGIN